ncbi:N-acetylmuramoyl-L-alanine amidase [Cyanobacterium sp. Dongsha4]|uniref:N-acetylmuramoyl-L-alanine amidase n=1 Tax=Cyanobacterium sp. DS4 TaxID=2878255 RepID=UPI002E814B86|nr:N-acetylmuramoyl-L-alanine amidase [Cyanobacterium sp. Dongsha4]WVL00928.1 N-acetylmuramoyl-L-alanine amidase [Cyanobacterium sp. Dongsha4]
MIKFYAFILSCLTFLLVTTPAYAGRLLFWRYETNQNRLLFTTDQGVQPTAQLIANPTRLVIDLPGTTLGRPTINETYGGLITSLRIGQFDSRTTRLVIELAPGYILDPQQIKIKGLSPTQWSVDLPQPQRGNFPAPSSSPSTPSDPYNSSSNSNSSSNTRSLSANNSNDNNSGNNNTASGGNEIQVTSSGLIVGIDGDHRNQIKVDRSRDRKKINFEISNINIPANFLKSWAVNQYGVENIEITQRRNSALLTLNVHPDSPDWQGSFSRMGGFVLWPQGGISRVMDLSNNSKSVVAQSNVSPARGSINNSQKTLIEAIEVNNNQLVVRGNQRIQAKGSWATANQVYQLRMENTDLAPSFKSPTLPSGSPISRLRIWQPDDKTVVLLIEPALGTRINSPSQLNERVVTLPLSGYVSRSSSTPVTLNRPTSSSNNSQAVTNIPVTPAPNSISPFDYTPRDNSRPVLPVTNSAPLPNRPVTNGRVVVMIDPGHGGKDPGAIGIGGIQEKHIVLSISQQLARILEQQGIQVRMTRDSDYFVSLQGRTEMANRINADLFVSIHANSAGANKPQVSGYETYYFQNGKALADTIHRNVLRRVDVNDRKVRQARFYVLRTSNMPAVLVETGFVTGREDAAKLTNPAFQRQIAEAIAAGIIEYIKTNRL